MKKFLATLLTSLMLATTSLAFAVPSVSQIESSMSQGNWQEAGAQLNEVLQAYPNNARAHYLYGQVLDRQGRYGDALAQIEQAKTLDPQIRFTAPARFSKVEAKIRHDAGHTGQMSGSGNAPALTRPAAGTMQQGALAAQRPSSSGPSMGAWIGIALLIVVIALVLRWTLRRARGKEDAQANDLRREQLKRATDLLNAVRSLKLDARLSTAPGHETFEKEAEGMETGLRELVESLSSRTDPVPPYQLDDLERQFESLKARVEGRPDPVAAERAAAESQSAYAREADRQFGQPPQSPWPPQQQQPPVVIQQGGGMMGGLGGLLTGVLLGDALSSRRERDVFIDDDELRRRGGDTGGGLDFGQGSNDWDDGSGGGGVDMGSNDDGSGGDWS